ncbi:MAG: NAD(P)H-dependent oxidoreductase [Burkholderiaceae bacterium]
MIEDASSATRPAARRRLLIVWFSRTGACEQLAGAAERAAREAARGDEDAQGAPAQASGAVDVRSLRCEAASPDDLLNADAYLFVAPENLATLAGAMKEFFDRCYYPVLGRIEGRPYAQIIGAGSDGQGAARQLARIATGWRLREVAEPTIVIVHAQTPERILAPKHLDDAQRAPAADVGAALASGLALGIF